MKVRLSVNNKKALNNHQSHTYRHLDIQFESFSSVI
jgi:hypothetical protein